MPVAATVHQRPPVFHAPTRRGSVAAVLGLDQEDLHPEIDPVRVDTGLCYTIIPLASQRALARVSLGPRACRRTSSAGTLRSIPCAFTGQDEPWVEARGLFPFAGITEDPATGSAAGPLAAYMAREGVLPAGGGARRAPGAADRPAELPHGGRLRRTPQAITDVRVGGSVQPVLRGELFLPDIDRHGRRPEGPLAHD